MVCRLYGPRFDAFKANAADRFWLNEPREFESFDAAVIFAMESVPPQDLDKIEIQTDGGELHTILTIARRYRDLAKLSSSHGY